MHTSMNIQAFFFSGIATMHYAMQADDCVVWSSVCVLRLTSDLPFALDYHQEAKVM